MQPLTAADLPYQIHHTVTYQEALDWGTEVIAREYLWRIDCLAQQADMSDLAREFCQHDLEVLAAAARDLEAKYNQAKYAC